MKKKILKVTILLLGAVFLTWLLEYRNRFNDAGAATGFVFAKTRVFFYSALLIFLGLMVIVALVRKPFKAIGIMAALILTIGYIHITKYSFRGTPLFPEDFQLGSQAGTLTKFIDVSEIVRLVIAIVLVVILAHILDKLTQGFVEDKRRRRNLIPRTFLAVAAIGFFVAGTGFVRHHGHENFDKIDFLNTEFVAWNQTQNYLDNGFLLGFLYNMNQLEIQEPEGYSEEKISELSSALASSKTGVELKDINIVLVLNESFYDVDLVRDYYEISGGDVTPNLHRIQENYPSGRMFSIDYGGGTANIEFEILTGLTDYWLSTVPYTNLVPKKKTIPSVATQLKNWGYETTAIHPFSGGMYKRNTVLPILGFDKLIFEDDFQYTEKDGTSEYINDRSSYKEVLDVLKKKSGGQLIHLVTMQNHIPFEKDEYGESKFTVSNAKTENEKDQLETYLMSLNLSDQYLGEFIEEVAKLNGKTVVLFYGDHAAAAIPRIMQNEEKAVRDLAYETPYFIYSNFEIENAPENLPLTTPNCLVNTMMNLLGAKKTNVQVLLDEVCEEAPILTNRYLGEEGLEESQTLRDYELLTYDLTAGKQYSLR